MTVRPLDVRESKKLAAREAIARSALRLAVERGAERVRVPDIAAASGVSPRTFNNYFSSKEEAIVWLAVERARRIVTTFRARPAGEELPDALMAAFMSVYGKVRAARAQPGARQQEAANGEEWLARLPALFSSETLRGAYLKGMLTVERDLADAIAQRLGSDGVDELYPRVLAAAVLGAERAAIVHWLRARGHIDIGEVIARALGHVLDGTGKHHDAAAGPLR